MRGPTSRTRSSRTSSANCSTRAISVTTCRTRIRSMGSGSAASAASRSVTSRRVPTPSRAAASWQEARRAALLPDAVERLEYLSQEAWHVADQLDGEAKVDALTVALRIDLVAERARRERSERN